MYVPGSNVCGTPRTPVSARHQASGAGLRLHKPLRGKACVVRSTDYSATATDIGILQLPPKQQLQEEDLVNVFNYERDLQGKYVPEPACPRSLIIQ
jgi:hypothetical protein